MPSKYHFLHWCTFLFYVGAPAQKLGAPTQVLKYNFNYYNQPLIHKMAFIIVEGRWGPVLRVIHSKAYTTFCLQVQFHNITSCWFWFCFFLSLNLYYACSVHSLHVTKLTCYLKGYVTLRVYLQKLFLVFLDWLDFYIKDRVGKWFVILINTLIIYYFKH